MPAMTLDNAVKWAQVVGPVLVVGGLIFTGCQISDARRAMTATTVYNLEKDWANRFEATKSAEFKECFEPRKAGTFPPDPICQRPGPRTAMLDLVSYYRLLVDLKEYGAITQADLQVRLKPGCTYLTSTGGTATLDEFNDKGFLREGLLKELRSICGRKGT